MSFYHILSWFAFCAGTDCCHNCGLLWLDCAHPTRAQATGTVGANIGATGGPTPRPAKRTNIHQPNQPVKNHASPHSFTSFFERAITSCQINKLINHIVLKTPRFRLFPTLELRFWFPPLGLSCESTAWLREDHGWHQRQWRWSAPQLQ